MSYQQIAVAIDFSPQSILAFERAVSIAYDTKAKLHLVHVVDTKSFGAIAAYDLTYAKQLKEEGEEKLQQLQMRALDASVKNVEISVLEGSPKVALTSLDGVDLIVCGQTGYTEFEKMIIGSVAERVLRAATCDVLIVK